MGSLFNFFEPLHKVPRVTPKYTPAQWTISRLIERFSNRTLCSMCRTAIRRSFRQRVLDAAGNYSLNDGEECKEGSMSSNCALCCMFISTLSEKDKELIRSYQQRSGIKDDGDETSYQIDHFRVHNMHFYLSEGLFEGEPTLVGISFQYWPPYLPAGAETMTYSLDLVSPKEPYFDSLENRLLSLETSTSSQSSIMTAKEWLSACLKHHHLCSKESDMRSGKAARAGGQFRLPTRLIDTGEPFTSVIRLCDSKDVALESKYLTLSHCWGEQVAVTLRHENLGDMKKEIDVWSLPRTFREALGLTALLGLRYIWIDALCIIQDSEADWQRESAQMSQIYLHSYCNLSATASKDGSGGLIRQERDTLPLQPLRVRVGNSYCNIVDSKIWVREIEDAPLNKRAWVCQERTLAPRNLHFGSTQLFWECDECTACESFPAGFPTCVVTSSRKRISPDVTGVPFRASDALRIPEDSDNKAPLHPYAVWGSIVETYSKCALTRETDRLIAIGGIAETLQPILNDEYLAGLWRRYLPDELLWVCTRKERIRPEEYVAPTWSWASVGGAVWKVSQIRNRDPGEILIEVIHAQLEHKTTNVFGQVKSGSIDLIGSLFKIVSTVGRKGRLKRVSIELDALTPTKMHVTWDFKTAKEARTTRSQEHLYCLPVTKSSSPLEGREMKGLILERLEDGSAFRRHGVFRAEEEQDLASIQAGIQYFKSTADTGIKTIPRKGEDMYNITLV